MSRQRTEVVPDRVNDRKWLAVLARDAGYDGTIVFAVRSTGITCRPSCPARRPRRHNVVFFCVRAGEGSPGPGDRPEPRGRWGRGGMEGSGGSRLVGICAAPPPATRRRRSPESNWRYHEPGSGRMQGGVGRLSATMVFSRARTR